MQCPECLGYRHNGACLPQPAAVPSVSHETTARRAALSPIGRFYLVECRSREALYIPETAVRRGRDMTAAEGLDWLRRQDEPLTVFEVIPAEGYVRDVSEDMARLWLAAFDGEEEDVPAFVVEHLSIEDVQQHYTDLRTWSQPGTAR